MKQVQFLFLILIVLSVNSCKDSATGTSVNGQAGFQSELSKSVLTGTVVDGNNIPIIAAEIHLFFKLHQSGLAKNSVPQNPTPITKIGFDVPKNARTVITLYRLGTREYISTLLDTILHAGRYNRTFEAGGLTNGFYVYQLISGDTFSEHLLFIQNDDVDVLVRTKPLVMTDLNGKFSLPQSIFGLDEEIIVTNENDQVISRSHVDSVGIVLHQNSKAPFVEWIHINKSSNVEATFILK